MKRPRAIQRRFDLELTAFSNFGMALASGTGRWHDSLKYASESFGDSADTSRLIKRHGIASKTQLFVLLVYLVRLLEELMADYTIWSYKHNGQRAAHLRLPNLDQATIVTNFPNPIPQRFSTAQSRWAKKVRNWSEAAIRDRVVDPQSLRSRNAVENVTQLAREFPRWFDLFKPYILRNLEIHNRGNMNGENFKKLPLCKIGKRPKWNMGTIYTMHRELSSLNLFLSENLVSKESK